VTQIIHDEDDDDEREVLARRWDAKWDARWYGLDWGDHFRAVSVA